MAPKSRPEPIPGWHVEDEQETVLPPDGDPTETTDPESPVIETPDSDDFSDATRGDRLQKILAAAGVGSRRACEQLIFEGEVSVNGHVITKMPAWVNPHKDHVTVRGRKIKTPESGVYIMLYKPRGYVCTNDDPEDRPRVVDLVRHHSRTRLYSVGRLDLDSSGLLLLTNDGELANRLTHPRYGVHKIYEVTVAGSLDDKDVQRLERGLYLTASRPRNPRNPRKSRSSQKPQQPTKSKATRTAQSSLEIIKRDRDQTRLRLELGEGRNRQIRRMMAQMGHPVKKLRRLRMGPLKLKDLQPGQWRELTPKELISLKKAAYGDPVEQKRSARR
ncbi:MAG: pseudouridine synthase [Planctomycetota bacterium]|nr:pseudouridine synthase [Planctomycetota bacterium]